MQEAADYIQILIESLQKKVAVLEEILTQNALQAETASRSEFDMDGFESTVNQKEELITSLLALDQGFDTVYDRVHEELKANKGSYTKQIQLLQQLIGQIAEKSVEIQASETRNKALVEAAFQKTRKQFGQGKTSVKAASDYYKNMSRVNYIDPQMMDTKK